MRKRELNLNDRIESSGVVVQTALATPVNLNDRIERSILAELGAPLELAVESKR